MSHEKEILENPPAMAEMAGAALDAETHHLPPHFEPGDVSEGLASLEAETES